MPLCFICEKNIMGLNNVQKGEQHSILYKHNGGYGRNKYSFEPDGTNYYYCPKCKRVLFDNDVDAVKFLESD